MNKRDMHRVVLGYVFVAGLYILLSDTLLGFLGVDTAMQLRIGMLKGLGFVAVTALALGALLRRIRSREAQRYIDTFDRQPAAMLLLDPDTHAIVHANARAAALFGIAREQLRGRRTAELTDAQEAMPPGAPGVVPRDSQSEAHVRRRMADGEPRELLIQPGPVERSGQPLQLAIVRDETERLRTERLLTRSNRLYAMLSRTNQLVVRGQDRQELLEGVCRIAVEEGQFLFAWICMQGPDARITPLAQYGDDKGYIDAVRSAPPATDFGPTGLYAHALREGSPVVCNDVLAESAAAPWREHVQRAGVRASAAFPLCVSERVFGTLNLYSPEAGFFDDSELGTLDEIARDLSYALENLVRVAALQTVSSVIEVSPVVLFRWRAEPGWPVDFVTANVARWGYSPAELLSGAVPFARLLHPEDAERVALEVERFTQEGRTEFTQTYRVVRPDGEIVEVEDQTRAIRDGDGRVRCYQGVVTDVTGLRRAERAMHELSVRMRHYLAVSPTITYAMVPWGEGFIPEWVSDNIESMLGYRVAEALDPDWWVTHIHPDDRAQAVARFARLPVGGELRHDYRLLRKDGSVLWVQDQMRRMHDGRGNVLHVVGALTDITEVKRTQQELLASEERLRLALEASRQGIFDLDLRSGEAAVSPEYALMLGEDPVAFRETHAAWVERLHPDDRERVEAAFRDYLAGELADYRVEYRQRIRGGGWKWLLSLGRIVERAADGTPVRMLGTHTDIDELKRSEARYRQLFAANPQPMWVYDTDSLRFLAVNDAAVQHYGYSREEFLGMTIAEIRPPEDIDRLHASIATLREDAPSLPTIWRHSKRDGTVFEVEISSHLMEYDGHRAEVVLAVDISMRLQLERARDAAEQKFRALVEQSLVGVLLIRQGQIEYFNPRAAEIFGYTDESIAQVEPESLIHVEDRAVVRELLQSVLSGVEQTGSIECRGCRRDGSEVLIGGQVKHAEIDGRPVVIAIVQDITAKVIAEREAERYLDRLEHAMMGTVGAISHMMDLRDPYTSGHERRVGEIAASIAAEMGLDEHTRHGLRIAGAMHDIGKITVPSEILSKPGRLSALEYEIIKTHAQQGYEVLKGVDFPWPVAEVARQHHERLDGSGYPRGLHGEEILLEARILAVADVVESMASHRPYRPTLGVDRALEEIERNSGIAFDTAVVDACLRLFRERAYVIPA